MNYLPDSCQNLESNLQMEDDTYFKESTLPLTDTEIIKTCTTLLMHSL